MKITEALLSSAKPDRRNANKGTARGREALRHSLETYGAGRSILLARDSTILAGNKTAQAAADLGHEDLLIVETDGTQLVAVRRTDLDPDSAEARLIALADNQVGALDLDWDASAIDEALKDGLDLSALWTGDELEELLASLTPAGGLLPGVDVDAIPEHVEPRVKRGEVWSCGRHRVMCGDSTDAGDVSLLMNGKEADLCFTSPPYDQQREYTGGVGDWLTLMQGVFASLPMSECGQVLVNLGLVHREGEWRPYWDPWIGWMRDTGWRSFGWYVWDQGPGLPGDWNGRLAPAHEFIFHFNQEAKKARKTMRCVEAGRVRDGTSYGLRDSDGTAKPVTPHRTHDYKIPGSVIHVTRHTGHGIEKGHPAVFPVALVTQIAEAFCAPGDGVYDPFLGSGTSVIGCESIGRVCFGMDVAEEYCSLAVTRYEQVTGEQAIRL